MSLGFFFDASSLSHSLQRNKIGTNKVIVQYLNCFIFLNIVLLTSTSMLIN